MTPANALQSQQKPPASTNYAALKPLLQLRDKTVKAPEHPIQKAMQNRWQHYHRKDNDVFRSIFGVMQLVGLMLSGEQDLRMNPATGGWGVIGVRRNTRDTGPINFMQFYANMLMSKSMSSNPDVLIQAGRNKDQCISAARAANAVNDHYEEIFYTPDFLRNESLLSIAGGLSVSRIYYDQSVESNAVLADVFEQKNVQMGGGYGFCADCQHVGTAEEFQPQGFGAFMAQARGQGIQSGGGGTTQGIPNASDNPSAGMDGYDAGGIQQGMGGGMCPQCRGTSVSIEQGASGALPSVSGQQEFQQGDLVIKQMPLFGLRFDLNKRPEDSSYLLNRQRIGLGMIHKVMGNVMIPNGSSQENDVGMDMMEALAKSGQAIRGAADAPWRREDQYKESVNFDEMYLAPEDYADIIIPQDEETIGGVNLPKGKLTDVFPDGLVAVGLNGMSVLLGLHAEKHKDHVFSWAWNKKMLSGVGRGIADSVEVQIQSNVMNAQRVDYWASTATPAVMYVKEMLAANYAKYIGSPKQNIPIDITKIPETMKLSEMIHQFQPASIPAGFTQYLETFLNGAMAYTTGVTEFSAGLPGAAGANDTATGAQLEQSTADMVNMPIFQEKGGARKRGAEITISQFIRHCPTKRTIQLTGKFGQTQSLELSGADLDTDLTYKIIKNSEIPKGPYQQRKNLTDFFAVIQTTGVSYLDLSEGKPEMAAKLEQAFDVDLETDSFDDVAELCRKRLNQMKAAVDAGVNDPMALVGVIEQQDPMTGQVGMVPTENGAIQPPISQYEPNLKRKAEWYSDILDTDELQNAPMVLRKACELLCQGQALFEVQKQSMIAQGQGAIEAAAAQPGLEAQQAMQPQDQPDQSAQLQAQQQQADAQTQAADHQAQAQQQEAQAAQEGQAQQVQMLAQAAAQAHESQEAEKTRKHDREMKQREMAHKEKIAAMAAKARQTAAKKKAS